jgi:hypothetical protein
MPVSDRILLAEQLDECSYLFRLAGRRRIHFLQQRQAQQPDTSSSDQHTQQRRSSSRDPASHVLLVASSLAQPAAATRAPAERLECPRQTATEKGSRHSRSSVHLLLLTLMMCSISNAACLRFSYDLPTRQQQQQQQTEQQTAQ